MGETRKLAAILVADVVGYTRLAGADEDRILARLRTLRSDLIDPTIAVHHGRIVKRTGDGSIIEFRSVVDAVNCAIEVQRAMVERNAEVAPDKRIEFRIGIHLGDVVEESDGDLMGDGVNIAARLQSAAKPGAICLSEQAYWQVKGRLDLAVTDLGPTEFKNIAEPMRAYSLEVGVPAQVKPETKAKPLQSKKRSSLASLAAGVVALLILIAGGASWLLNANRPASVATRSPAEAAPLSIVVLPFANLSGDPAQDYLADALTDELITGVTRVQDSFVIARNTAFTYKGKPVDAKAIGKDLGVRYVLPPFDALEPTIDIALKNLGGVWSKNPKFPRTTRRAGKRVGHGERLLTIGGHLRRPSRTAHDGISLAATMLLDDARTPFGVAPRLPWRWLRYYVDPALRVDGQKAEAQETTELLHARVVLPATPPLGGADGEPDLVAGRCAINGLKHQFEREALLHLADYDEFG